MTIRGLGWELPYDSPEAAVDACIAQIPLQESLRHLSDVAMANAPHLTMDNTKKGSYIPEGGYFDEVLVEVCLYPSASAGTAHNSMKLVADFVGVDLGAGEMSRTRYKLWRTDSRRLGEYFELRDGVGICKQGTVLTLLGVRPAEEIAA